MRMAPQVALGAKLGVGDEATLQDNLDKRTAVLTNSEGVPVRILPYLAKRGCAPRPETRGVLREQRVGARQDSARFLRGAGGRASDWRPVARRR